MKHKLRWLTLANALLILAACSSGGSSTPTQSKPPPAAVTTLSGAVVDNFILSSTVTAYAVSGAGVVGACIPATPATTPASCATATSDGSGNYTVSLGSYSGAVLLQATGGTYTDTVTGKTGLPIPTSLTLSVLLSSVSPGATATVAQITPLTTIAAQLALQQAAQGTALATAVTNAQTEVQTYFGGLADIVSTAILDLTKTNCGAATNQASADASLLIDGVAELASQFHVMSDALFAAIIADATDGTLDGTASGTPIGVPLAAGGGTVPLTTIYGSGLALSLKASIAAFQASARNACAAAASSTLQQNIAKAPPQLQPPLYSYTVSGTYTLSGQFLSNPQIELSMQQPGAPGQANCSGDLAVASSNLVGFTKTAFTSLTAGNSQAFSVSIGGTPGINLNTNQPDYNWNDSCGTIQASISLAPVPGQSCSITQGPSGTVTFTTADSTDKGDHNTVVEGTNIVVACAINVEPVTGTVMNLAAGTTLTVTLTDLTTSSNGSVASVVGSGVSPQPLSFVAAGHAAPGVQYGDLISVAAAVTSTGTTTQTCVIAGQGTPTTPVTAALSLSVSCTTSGGTGPGGPSTALNGPGGMAFDAAGHLWVANSAGDTSGSVLEFSVTVDSSGNATGLTQVGKITAGINNPGRLAFDGAGNLYVTNIGSNAVTVYETEDAALSNIATIGGSGTSNINRPLGVAVDTTTGGADSGYVYVANNSGNSVAVFSPPAGKLSATNNSFTYVTTLTGDALGDAFSAPGALSFFATPASAQTLGVPAESLLFVGLGPGFGADSVLMYDALPLSASSRPFYDLNNGNNCSTGPSGPTALQISLNVANAQHPLLFYVASYYSNTIAAYDVVSIIANPTAACPVPFASISTNIAQPEGLAVDSFRNVFVSDASANHITVYNPGTASSTNLPYAYAFTYSGGT